VEIGLSIQSIGLVRVARSGAHSYEGAAVVGLGEASAGDGNSSGAQGVVWDHAAFPKGKAVGEGRPPYSPESCEAGICGGSVVGRRA
jgi:hypothetical protein